MLSACHGLVTLMNACLPSADQFADTEGTTIFVKGFDKYLGEEAIRQQLTETFAECGAVSTVRLPTDRESGELKGIGFIEFGSVEAKVCTEVQSPLACLSLLHVCAGRVFAVLCAAQQSSALSGSCQSLNSNRTATCLAYTPLNMSCCLQWHTFLSAFLPDFRLTDASTSVMLCLHHQGSMPVMQQVLVPTVFANHVHAC